MRQETDIVECVVNCIYVDIGQLVQNFNTTISRGVFIAGELSLESPPGKILVDIFSKMRGV